MQVFGFSLSPAWMLGLLGTICCLHCADLLKKKTGDQLLLEG
jgi:hypothetical protein